MSGSLKYKGPECFRSRVNEIYAKHANEFDRQNPDLRIGFFLAYSPRVLRKFPIGVAIDDVNIPTQKELWQFLDNYKKEHPGRLKKSDVLSLSQKVAAAMHHCNIASFKADAGINTNSFGKQLEFPFYGQYKELNDIIWISPHIPVQSEWGRIKTSDKVDLEILVCHELIHFCLGNLRYKAANRKKSPKYDNHKEWCFSCNANNFEELFVSAYSELQGRKIDYHEDKELEDLNKLFKDIINSKGMKSAIGIVRRALNRAYSVGETYRFENFI